MTTYNDFFDNLEEKFNEIKIRHDFIESITLPEKGKIDIESTSEIEKSIKKISISREDRLTIMSINVVKKFKGQLFFPYRVDVIVGEYIDFKQASFLKPQKCVAQMLYNKDFDILDIDFVHGF